ncbi:hypothetical protein BSKO_12772 [Bryopsis sp. KO-2023]|nr:hypothetical protein BSKO_12772 [Bryopsis sp. KO-2023]
MVPLKFVIGLALLGLLGTAYGLETLELKRSTDSKLPAAVAVPHVRTLLTAAPSLNSRDLLGRRYNSGYGQKRRYRKKYRKKYGGHKKKYGGHKKKYGGHGYKKHYKKKSGSEKKHGGHGRSGH